MANFMYKTIKFKGLHHYNGQKLEIFILRIK